MFVYRIFIRFVKYYNRAITKFRYKILSVPKVYYKKKKKRGPQIIRIWHLFNVVASTKRSGDIQKTLYAEFLQGFCIAKFIIPLKVNKLFDTEGRQRLQ